MIGTGDNVYCFILIFEYNLFPVATLHASVIMNIITTILMITITMTTIMINIITMITITMTTIF